MRYLPLLALAAFSLFGCVEGERPVPGVEVHDSGGVSLVVHSGVPGHLLRTDGAPVALVGSGSDGSELFRVRGGVLLPDGGFAIANSGSNEVLFFGNGGDLLRRVGGEGRGPEEFTNILWIQSRGEGELSAYDAGNLRLNRYDQFGEMISSSPVRFEPEEPPSDNSMVGRGFPLGLTEEDRLLSVPWPAAVLDGTEGPLPLQGELRSYSPDLSEFYVIDTVQLRTWYETPQPEGAPIEQILESPIFVFSANGPWLAYSEAAGHRVTVLKNGTPFFVIVEDRSRVPFRPDSLPSHMHHHADSLPAYRTVQVDSEGRIWLQPPEEGDAGVVRWRVFSGEGFVRSVVDLPASTTVLDAMGDRVLLLERDEFDVETVALRVLHGIPTRDWN